MIKSKIIIIHGTKGNPQENWFPWLADQLRSLGQKVVVPSFPTPEGQSLASWQAAFTNQVGKLTEDTIIVAHSLGSAMALRLLEESNVSILGTFLVCGFIGELGRPEFDPLNATFFLEPFDWQRIRANAGIIRVYNSDNDPYVRLEKGVELARNLETNMIIIKEGGHINASAGFTKFEKLLKDIILEFR